MAMVLCVLPSFKQAKCSCQECWLLQHCFITINNKFNPACSNINPKLNIQYSLFILDCDTQLHFLSFGILHKQEYNTKWLWNIFLHFHSWNCTNQSNDLEVLKPSQRHIFFLAEVWCFHLNTIKKLIVLYSPC